MINSGIYIITNYSNNKIYIGSSKDLKRRISQHKYLLSKNKHHNKHLQLSYNKYGKDNFNYKVLENCEIKDLINREQYYIDELKPQYNIALIILSSGYVWTDEMKLNQSKRLKGKITSEETKQKLKIIASNWIRNDEVCKKISESKKGKRLHQKSLDASRLSIIKNIIQYDKNMNKINEFESIIDASKKLNINHGNIQSVCCNRRKSAGGFIFKYKENENS